VKRLLRVGIAGLAGLVILYCACVNHNEAYQAGIAWNLASGELWLQEGGYHLTAPWTLVARMDTRPQRVCVTSASPVAFNCKLVQFQKESWRQFAATEGWRYYWLANRFSLNLGYHEEYRGCRDILRGYAFSARQYPFVKVLADVSS
jgi:hypothetical protein